MATIPRSASELWRASAIEFEIGYSDESYSFYPYELILPCTTDDIVSADDFATFGDVTGRLVAGFDVGRRRDLSELSIFEEVGGKKVYRLLRSYDHMPFADQELDLRRMLTTLPIGRLSIDQNGIGMHLAENLDRDFGQVVPETFSNESKEILPHAVLVRALGTVLIGFPATR